MEPLIRALDINTLSSAQAFQVFEDYFSYTSCNGLAIESKSSHEIISTLSVLSTYGPIKDLLKALLADHFGENLTILRQGAAYENLSLQDFRKILLAGIQQGGVKLMNMLISDRRFQAVSLDDFRLIASMILAKRAFDSQAKLLTEDPRFQKFSYKDLKKLLNFIINGEENYDLVSFSSLISAITKHPNLRLLHRSDLRSLFLDCKNPEILLPLVSYENVPGLSWEELKMFLDKATQYSQYVSLLDRTAYYKSHAEELRMLITCQRIKEIPPEELKAYRKMAMDRGFLVIAEILKTHPDYPCCCIIL